MGTKLENLQTVFNSMHDYAQENDSLVTQPMTLYIWIDTNQEDCKPITGEIKLEFSGNHWDEVCPLTESKLFAMLTLIDKITPIYEIVIEGHPFKVFLVSATEEYMKKGCI